MEECRFKFWVLDESTLASSSHKEWFNYENKKLKELNK